MVFRTNLHGKVMVMIVNQNVANALVQHREQRGQGTQTCEIHDVVQCLCMLKAAVDKAIKGEIWL